MTVILKFKIIKRRQPQPPSVRREVWKMFVLLERQHQHYLPHTSTHNQMSRCHAFECPVKIHYDQRQKWHLNIWNYEKRYNQALYHTRREPLTLLSVRGTHLLKSLNWNKGELEEPGTSCKQTFRTLRGHKWLLSTGILSSLAWLLFCKVFDHLIKITISEWV